MDAGCGVGGAMLWLEKHEPSWRLEGFTLSPAQHEYIQTRLAPSHRFTAHLTLTLTLTLTLSLTLILTLTLTPQP